MFVHILYKFHSPYLEHGEKENFFCIQSSWGKTMWKFVKITTYIFSTSFKKKLDLESCATGFLEIYCKKIIDYLGKLGTKF
jgi:hypothetical protein